MTDEIASARAALDLCTDYLERAVRRTRERGDSIAVRIVWSALGHVCARHPELADLTAAIRRVGESLDVADLHAVTTAFEEARERLAFKPQETVP